MGLTMAEEYPVPENTCLFQHQIAGHCHGTGDTKLGILKHENGSILKPGKREVEFYQRINGADCIDEDILRLRSFTPAFRGIWDAEVFGNRVRYVMIEDITEPFSKPSILDVKIGAVTWDPTATDEKIKREREKYPAASVIGFRILGMRVYQHSKDSYLVLGKEYGKQQPPENIVAALHTFFDNQRGQHVQEIINDLLTRLRNLEEWYRSQRKLAFYSSSLLLVYEAEKLGPVQINRTKEYSIISDVRMIDFAHVFPTTEQDNNYLFGLNKLIDSFRELLSKV